MLCCRGCADGLESAVAAERNERRVSAARDAGVERVRRVRYASSCNCKLPLRNLCRGAPVDGLLFAVAAGWNERRVSAARDKGVERVRCEPKGARPEGFQRYHVGFKHALQDILLVAILPTTLASSMGCKSFPLPLLCLLRWLQAWAARAAFHHYYAY